MAKTENSRFDELIDNLQSVVDQIKDSTDEREGADVNFTLEMFWTRIGVCSKSISASATKLSLAFSGSPFPTKQELRPLISDIEQSMLALVSVYYSLPSSQGRTLRKLVADSMVSLAVSMQSLLRALDSKPEGQSCTQQLQSTGTVWEICDKFNTLPPDNSAAVIMFAKDSQQLVSDALKELIEAEQSGASRACDDLDLEDQLTDLDITSSDWSDADLLVLRACVGVVKTAEAAVKKVTKALVAVGGQTLDVTMVGELYSYVELIRSVSPSVDDLVSSLYPPVNLTTVHTQCEQVCAVIKALLNGARCQHFTTESDNSWLHFLLSAVDHNQQKVLTTVSSMLSSEHNDSMVSAS